MHTKFEMNWDIQIVLHIMGLMIHQFHFTSIFSYIWVTRKDGIGLLRPKTE